MSAFTIRVEGNLCTADRAEIRRALSLLLSAGDIHEIRGLPSGRSILIKKDDLDRAEEAAAGLSEGQVYWSLNPIRPDHMRATDGNVARRRWLLIDVDTIRPEADSSSTDAEKSACGALAVKIAEWLAEHGWPSPIITDSGNGWHLLYRIDLPNDPLSKQIIRSLLKSLASRFDTAEAKVDQSVYNASRIAKLPGTMARKGRETEDRPHRMARIAWEPERIEVVSIEMLRAMEGPEPSTPPDVVPFRTLATDGGKSAYIRAATEGELLRVALASEGDRNNALNRAAFSMAQFHLWPGFNEQEAKARLRLIAERAGLGIQEIDRTIASGWEAGRKEPRPRPIDVGANGKAMNGQEMPSQGPLTIRASEVKPEEVRWIWPNVIARNFLNLFAGRTGIGKSFIMCDVAARLSRGLPMPDGTNTGKVSNTLFISEDPYQYVLVPRLMELGADLGRIGFLRWEAMAGYELSDTQMLETAWEEVDRPELIVVDPPANFLGGKDEHKNAETRGVLMRLVSWLESRPVAICLITHFNKGGAGKALDAIYRIMSSVAWGSTSRIACGCEVDPDDPTRCIFGGIKNNVGEKARVLGYRIEKTESLARIAWLGPVEVSMDDAINKVKRKTRGQSAVEWITEQFREKREWPSDELRSHAREYGLSKNALWEPEVQGLPIKKRQRCTSDGRRYWVWVAEEGWPKPNGNLGNLGICEPNPLQDNEYHRSPED